MADTKEKKEKVPLRSLVGCIIINVFCKECPYLEECKAKAQAKLKEGQEIHYI